MCNGFMAITLLLNFHQMNEVIPSKVDTLYVRDSEIVSIDKQEEKKINIGKTEMYVSTCLFTVKQKGKKQKQYRAYTSCDRFTSGEKL